MISTEKSNRWNLDFIVAGDRHDLCASFYSINSLLTSVEYYSTVYHQPKPTLITFRTSKGLMSLFTTQNMYKNNVGRPKTKQKRHEYITNMRTHHFGRSEFFTLKFHPMGARKCSSQMCSSVASFQFPLMCNMNFDSGVNNLRVHTQFTSSTCFFAKLPVDNVFYNSCEPTDELFKNCFIHTIQYSYSYNFKVIMISFNYVRQINI